MRRDLERRLRAVEVKGSRGYELWIHQGDGRALSQRGQEKARTEHVADAGFALDRRALWASSDRSR